MPLNSKSHSIQEAWRSALDHALQLGVGTPSNPDYNKPEIRLLDANPSGNRFEIELCFRSDTQYCCGEHGCHLSTCDRSWWHTFRAHLLEVSDRDPPPMIMSITGVVEPGAILGMTETSEGFTYLYKAMEQSEQ